MKTLKIASSFVGIDLHREDLSAAHEEFQDQSVKFIEMNAENLDFEDASFDTVCIANSLHHLDNIPLVLSEMKRVLKPGGYFIVEEMYQDGAQSEAQRTGIMEHHWTAKIDRMRDITHHETLKRNQIIEVLIDLHLVNLEILDSSRYVDCLFCSQRYDCEDPQSASRVEFFINGIKKTLQKLKPSERTPELVAEAEQLKFRAKEIGVADASIVFIFGRK